MLVLILASLVQWGRVGNHQLRDNWIAGQAASPKTLLKQAFYGFAIGMLGLTGFECMIFSQRKCSALTFTIGAPALITSIKTGHYPSVLRNLHITAFVFNLSSALLVLALIPLETSVKQANILSTLASVVRFSKKFCPVS